MVQSQPTKTPHIIPGVFGFQIQAQGLFMLMESVHWA